MRFTAPALIVFALAAGTATAQTAAPDYPPVTIGNSQLRVLPPTPAGRHYQLYVGLPASYATETSRKYPVVYVTDGYWDFQKLDAIRGGLVYDRVAPEFIIVGIGYAGEKPDYNTLRTWELTPVAYGQGATGHAADYLDTIEKTIIPLVERDYRADPSFRVMAGASLGGLFTLYSMYARPGLFQAYVAVTPAVSVANDWLFGFENEFVKAGKTLKGRLWVSGGGNESPVFLGGILRYNQRVSSRKHPGLTYQFRIIDGERHAGNQVESYTRGLRFVFEQLAPETGPSR
jgi:uncharacterized protein